MDSITLRDIEALIDIETAGGAATYEQISQMMRTRNGQPLTPRTARYHAQRWTRAGLVHRQQLTPWSPTVVYLTEKGRKLCQLPGRREPSLLELKQMAAATAEALAATEETLAR